MIIKKITYEALIEDRKLLHKLLEDNAQNKKDKRDAEKDKKDAELEKLPDIPREFICDNCNGTGYSEKKFKRFKKKFINYHDEEVIQEKFLCVENQIILIAVIWFFCNLILPFMHLLLSVLFSFACMILIIVRISKKPEQKDL